MFLDPVGGDKRTVFIYVRNTSDRPNFDIETPLKSAIAGRGYRVVDDPDKAHFKLLTQVLSVSKMDITVAEAALGAGYGGAIAGVAVGGDDRDRPGNRNRRRCRRHCRRHRRNDCQRRGQGRHLRRHY